MKVLALLCTSFYVVSVEAQVQERIFVDAKVNGAPVRMAFDTGADSTHLYKAAAERLGLTMSPIKSWFGRRNYFGTEKCCIAYWGLSLNERIPVLALPPFLQPSEEGLIGWSVVSKKVLAVDAVNQQVHLLQEVPHATRSWTRFAVDRDWRILALKIPGEAGVILVDTGSPSGIGIPARAWLEWKRKAQGQPVTLESAYTPAAGLFAREQAWASGFSLGPLALTEVVIEEADPWSIGLAGTNLLVTLGLAALKRVDLIVDGKRKFAYLRPKSSPAPAYDHNRLGAVFLPPSRDSDELVARVVEGSPAAAAGIRDGDVLLKVGTTQLANWRTDTSRLASFSGRQPAGTQVNVTLRRSNEVFQTTATLRDILAPTVVPH